MPKQRLRALLLVSVPCAGLLSGCVTTLAPVQFVPRVAFASVTDVSLAVGPGGVKHYAWTECSGSGPTLTCVLVYSRMVMGAVVYSYGFVNPPGTVIQNPAVAVTSSGDAYVVYSQCTYLSDCFDYWTMFPAAGPESVEPVSALLYIFLVASEAPPQVEARGDDVYAAYYVKMGGYVRLRYRQLGGSGAEVLREGLIDITLWPQAQATLGIDSNGDLHAVWVRNPVTDTYVAYSNNIGSDNNFDPATVFDDGANVTVSYPDLALEDVDPVDDDRAYIAYSFNNSSTDIIRVRCLDAVPGNCYRDAATLNVPEVGGDWDVYRNVRLELIGAQPQVVFAATHETLGDNNDIWWYLPDDLPAVNTPPTQVTDTADVAEGQPLIVEEHSTSGDEPVVAWRQYRIDMAAALSPAGIHGYCGGDVFYTFSSAANITQAFTDRDTCGNYGFDLAANGAWVAGVWLDEELDLIEAHAAWTAFNANVVFAPQVNK